MAVSMYSEEDLLALYDDLLALPVEASPEAQAKLAVEEPAPNALEIVTATAQRLLYDGASTSSVVDTDPAKSVRYSLIACLEEFYGSLESFPLKPRSSENGPLDGQEPVEAGEEPIPLGLMTSQEWSALVSHCVRRGDIIV